MIWSKPVVPLSYYYFIFLLAIFSGDLSNWLRCWMLRVSPPLWSSHRLYPRWF